MSEKTDKALAGYPANAMEKGRTNLSVTEIIAHLKGGLRFLSEFCIETCDPADVLILSGITKLIYDAEKSLIQRYPER